MNKHIRLIMLFFLWIVVLVSLVLCGKRIRQLKDELEIRSVDTAFFDLYHQYRMRDVKFSEELQRFNRIIVFSRLDLINESCYNGRGVVLSRVKHLQKKKYFRDALVYALEMVKTNSQMCSINQNGVIESVAISYPQVSALLNANSIDHDE